MPTIEKHLSIRLVGFISLGELPRTELKAKQDEKKQQQQQNKWEQNVEIIRDICIFVMNELVCSVCYVKSIRYLIICKIVVVYWMIDFFFYSWRSDRQRHTKIYILFYAKQNDDIMRAMYVCVCVCVDRCLRKSEQ